MMKLTFICLCLILYITSSVFAKEWRDLTPLRSTRLNVITLLGYPDSYDTRSYYDIAEGYVAILMIRQPCEPYPLDKPDKEWEMRNLVSGISIRLNNPIPMNEIDFEWEKFYINTNFTGTAFYNDDKEGISYAVLDGKVISISYGPTEKDLQEYYDKRKQCVQSK